jgi:putrescine importer
MSSIDPTGPRGSNIPEPSALPQSTSSWSGGGAQEAVAELEGKYHYKQELRRGLTVTQLTAYGINWMAPFGPAVIWGFLIVQSGGTVALPYALAAVGMLLTAAAYACMVPNFPLAGSAYNYISKGWNPYLGFMVGWVLIIDYLLFPASTTVSTAYYTQAILPEVPFWVLIGGFGLFTGTLNILGVELMAKMGLWLLAITGTGLLVCFVVWSIAAGGGIGYGTVFTLEPFKFSSFSALMGATSLSLFNYLGFDAITTLAEESNNPKKDIPIAIYLTIAAAMIMFVGIGYFGQLPLGNEWQNHVNDANWVNTALYQVSVIAAGKWFGLFYYIVYLICIAVFNVVSTVSAARLVYGMGRDDLLPRRIFGAVNKRFGTPHWNIVIVIVLIFILAAGLDLNTIALLINFGALTGFFMMNLNTIWAFIIAKNVTVMGFKQGSVMYYLRYLVVPLLGAVVIGYLWWNLSTQAHIVGAIWAVLGVIFLAIKTNGFRKLPPVLEV